MQPARDYIHTLMIEKITGSISEQDNRLIEQLMADDPKVKAVYERLLSRFEPDDLDTNFQRFKTNEGWQDIPATATRKRRRRMLLLAGASAAAALVAGLFIIINHYYPQNNIRTYTTTNTNTAPQKSIQLQLANGRTIDLSFRKGQLQAGAATLNNAGKSLSYTEATGSAASAQNVLTVPIGLDYKIALSDGTTVWLNSATTLRFPFTFTGNAREISLSGEAYLQVAPNAKKPFIVHTPLGTVKVLGTAFNVNTYDSGIIRVALVEGGVQVKAGRQEVAIRPGEEAVYTDQQQHITVQEFDDEEVLSWRLGIHYFHNATVATICNVFPRWYGSNIVIDDQRLANNRFTGILNRNEPLETFLRTLKATTAINDYYFDQDGLLHLK
jgi:ferric-dicitrate binding protein FerR (iron transport regulator)